MLVADLNQDGARDTVNQIAEEGGEARSVRTDVSSPEDCRVLVDEAVRAWGRLDIACNNAGIWPKDHLTGDYSIECWERIIRVNLSGVFYGMRYQKTLWTVSRTYTRRSFSKRLSAWRKTARCCWLSTTFRPSTGGICGPRIRSNPRLPRSACGSDERRVAAAGKLR